MLRYAAVPVTIRFETGAERDLVRVVAAGARVGAPLTVSAAAAVSPAVAAYLASVGAAPVVEDAAAWRARAAGLAVTGGRVRLIGGSASDVAAATDGAPNVAVYAGPVVSAGRVELLTFLHEQAVSITAHRFGNPRRYEVPPLVR